MNEEKLRRANEIHEEIEILKAQSVNLSSSVYHREKEVPYFKKFLKLFNSDSQRERHKDHISGIWYWTISGEPEMLIELDLEDLKLLKESKDKRIVELQKEFKGL